MKILNICISFQKQLEEQVAELKSRVGSLQQELDNSEAVQKDFVRLSQSLQVQLERIREADTQVRWQHDEDVEECQSCRTGFSFTRSKVCIWLLQMSYTLLKTYSEHIICFAEVILASIETITHFFCVQIGK
jgi:hypothetical protein